jgi:GT2 family glycosyltransferase
VAAAGGDPRSPLGTAALTPPEPLVLSVVVVSYQSRPDILACLRSLREHPPGVETEVFVVDNASTDGTAEAIAAEFPGVHVIARSQNEGFSVANNAALERAQGRYTLLLNPDTLVRPGAIDALVGFMDEHPEAGLAGCRLVNARGEVDASAGGLPELRMQISSWLGLRKLVPRRLARWLVSVKPLRRAMNLVAGGYFVPFDADAAPREVEFLSGACMLVRQEVWQTTGRLDERFFLYLEDADICARARRDGWRLYYLPGATIVHVGGRSFAALSGGRTHHLSRERAESLVHYFRKHRGRRGELAIRVVMAVTVAARLIAARVRGDRSEAAVLAGVLRVATSRERRP